MMSEKILCQRCNENYITVKSRKEFFCDKCFVKFISLKQRKHMMSDEYCQNIFKTIYPDKKKSQKEADIENSKSKILVPLSLGSSSLVMLDILNDVLSEQKNHHKGKTGFQIDILLCYLDNEFDEMIKRISYLKENILKNNIDKIRFHLVDLDNFFQDNTDNISVLMNENEYKSQFFHTKIPGNFLDLLKSCRNKSCNEDLLMILIKHVVNKFALQNNIKVILWGHSMTKLGSEILSLTIKGRGSQIPNFLDNSEFDENYGSCFKKLYPLRDVLLLEIDAYCYIKNLMPYILNYKLQDTLLIEKWSNTDTNYEKKSKLTKNMTVNELTTQYFDNIEQSYPSVISTVVRTGLKLGNSNLFSKSLRCQICNNKIGNDPSEWLENITVAEGHPVETSEDRKNFEKWSELNLEMKSNLNTQDIGDCRKDGKNATICYGCIIILKGMKNNCIVWPERNSEELMRVLKEYSL